MSIRTFGFIILIFFGIVFLTVAVFSGRIDLLSLDTWPGLIGGAIIGIVFCIYANERWPESTDFTRSARDSFEINKTPIISENFLGTAIVIVVISLLAFALYTKADSRAIYGHMGFSCFFIAVIYLIHKNITQQ